MKYCLHCMTKISEPNKPCCPECGKQHSEHNAKSYELPAGTLLCSGRYLVGRSIEQSGFSITYIGFDIKMGRKAVIKETFYKDFCSRSSADKTNSAPLNVHFSQEVSFEDIISKTSRECRILSDTSNLRGIVKIYDWFTENRTVYIVMEYVEGCALDSFVKENGAYAWTTLYRQMKPLMQSLAQLHKGGILHCGIKPDNIVCKQLFENSYEPVLINLELAESDNTKMQKAAEISLTPEYAPIEQRKFTQKNGTYTDVYSLAATLYYALTGEQPQANVTDDVLKNFPLLSQLASAGKISDKVFKALKWALEPVYYERCQTIDELLEALDETEEKPKPKPIQNKPQENGFKVQRQPDKTDYAPNDDEDEPEEKKSGSGKGLKVLLTLLIIIIAAPLVTLGGYIVYNKMYPKELPADTPDQPNAQTKVDKAAYMPSVVGLTTSQYELVLDSKEYDVEVVKIPAVNIDEDIVAKQEPAAGERMRTPEDEKYKVTLYVTTDEDVKGDEYLLAPKCMDKTADEAIETCEKLGLKTKCIVQENSNDPIGEVVVYQSPMYGEFITKDVTITLMICKGKERQAAYKIEDYFGLKYSDVKKKLEEAGWKVTSKDEERNDYNDGVIIGQSIEKGKTVDMLENDEIMFYVAREPKKKNNSSASSKKNN